MDLERLRRLAAGGDLEAARHLLDEATRRGSIDLLLEAVRALGDATPIERMLVDAWTRGELPRTQALAQLFGLVLGTDTLRELERLYFGFYNYRGAVAGEHKWFERTDLLELLTEVALEPDAGPTCRESIQPRTDRWWLVARPNLPGRDFSVALAIIHADSAAEALRDTTPEQLAQLDPMLRNQVVVRFTVPAYRTSRSALRRGRLRHLLTATSELASFRRLLELLRAWPRDDPDGLAAAIADADALLAPWPDALREAPPRWADDLAAGDAPPGSTLVRHLRLPWRGFRRDDAGLPDPATLARFCASPALTPLRQLSAASMPSALLRDVLDAPHLPPLEALALDDVALAPADLAALAESRHAASLQALRVSRRLHAHVHGRTDPTAPGLRELLARCTALRSLTLAGLASANEILFDNPVLGRVRELDLRGALLGIIALRGLLGGLEHLEALTIADNGRPLGPVMIGALVESPALRGLRVLRLPADGPGIDGAACLAKAPPGPLAELDLSGWQMGDHGLAALADAGLLEHVHTLALAGNALREAGARRLAEALRRAPLRSLTLAGNPIGLRALRALLDALQHTVLRELDLSGIRLGAAGARALADWPGLASLRSLRLAGCGFGEVARTTLQTAMPATVALDLGTP